MRAKRVSCHTRQVESVTFTDRDSRPARRAPRRGTMATYSLADAIIAIAPPPPTYLLGRNAELPTVARRGNARRKRVSMSASCLLAPPSVAPPIFRTAEAFALVSGKIPDLRFASSELKQSLLPIDGTPSLPRLRDLDLMHNLAPAEAASSIDAVSTSSIAAALAAAHAATSAASSVAGGIATSPAVNEDRNAIESIIPAPVVATPHSTGENELPTATAVPPPQFPDATAVTAAAVTAGAAAVTATAVTATAVPANSTKRKAKGTSEKTISARNLVARYKVDIPDDLNKLKPIPTTRTKVGWLGVYPGRGGKFQAQLNHRSIGGYSSAWEAGVAVTAYLVVMAQAEEKAEQEAAQALVDTSASQPEGGPEDEEEQGEAGARAPSEVVAGGEAEKPTELKRKRAERASLEEWDIVYGAGTSNKSPKNKVMEVEQEE